MSPPLSASDNDSQQPRASSADDLAGWLTRLQPRYTYADWVHWDDIVLHCRDDCWELEQRAKNGTGPQQPDPTKFPQGIKNVTDYVHGLGLKFGLYTAQASKTCGGKAGSCGFEHLDAAQYAEWGVYALHPSPPCCGPRLSARCCTALDTPRG